MRAPNACMREIPPLTRKNNVRLHYVLSDPQTDDDIPPVNLLVMPEDSLCIQRNTKGPEWELIFDSWA